MKCGFSAFPWCLTLATDGRNLCESCSANLLSLNTQTSCLPMAFNFGHWWKKRCESCSANLLSLNTHTSSLPMVFNFGHWWQETGMNPVQQICCPWIHTPAVFPWCLTLAIDGRKLVWILFSKSAVPEYTHQQWEAMPQQVVHLPS